MKQHSFVLLAAQNTLLKSGDAMGNALTTGVVAITGPTKRMVIAVVTQGEHSARP